MFVRDTGDLPVVDRAPTGPVSEVLLALRLVEQPGGVWGVRLSVVNSDPLVAGRPVELGSAGTVDGFADLADYAPLWADGREAPTARTRTRRWSRFAVVVMVAVVGLLLGVALILSSSVGRAVVPDVSATVTIPVPQHPDADCGGRPGGCTTEGYRAAGTSASAVPQVCFTSSVLGAGPQGRPGQG